MIIGLWCEPWLIEFLIAFLLIVVVDSIFSSLVLNHPPMLFNKQIWAPQ